jgi:hypothetical protein
MLIPYLLLFLLLLLLLLLLFYRSHSVQNSKLRKLYSGLLHRDALFPASYFQRQCNLVLYYGYC